jgi:hypothetical protein
MNSDTSNQSEFVLRRLGEGLSLFGHEINPFVWLVIVGAVLLVGIVYVVWMYRKDRESIPLVAAILLALLRIGVYGLLAIAFLLPAQQNWERAEKRSRVAIVIDVSDSIGKVTDEVPSASRPADALEYRMDKILNFLSDNDVAFLHNLMEKNPVVVYRFGTRIDEESALLKKEDKPWARDDWKSWLKLDLKQWALQGLSPDGRKVMLDQPDFQGDKPGDVDWALAWLKKDKEEVLPKVAPQSGFTPEDRKKIEENRDKLANRVDVVKHLTQETNVGESVLAALNREATNMLQGIVVISDGRSTQGSESSVGEVRARAKRENIPVFTVVVGEDRLPISIQIVDVQRPEQAPPDERFVVRAEIDGTGLAGKEKPVFLDVYRPQDNPKKDKPFHTIESKATFAPGEPPHAQVEFALDPTATEGKDKLPPDFFKPVRQPEPGDAKKDPMKKVADESQYSSGKPELFEGEWKFIVRVPKDENEAFVNKEHLADAVSVQVIKKPLRVLLFSGGAERDFQFVRTLFVREKDEKRCELSVFVQNLGRDGRDVQDVEPERRLSRFPNTLLVGEAAAKLDPKEKYYNLDEYDVIIAFDPDWSELLPEQFTLLKTWIERQAGGLILVGGPINTFQLARAVEDGKLRTLIDLYPVMPGDSVLPVNAQVGVRRNTKKAWYLNFPGANRDMEFLKLDEDKDAPLAGWDEFFFRKEKRDDRDTEAYRGFYSAYPIQSVKKGAIVVATFADPAAKMPDGTEQPYLVTMEYPQGRIVFLGSGEVWRLRKYKEIFFDRFWIKLARYASAGSRIRQNKRGVLVMGKQFTSGNFVRLEAQMFGPDSNPLPETTEVKGFISPANSDNPKDRKEIKLNPKHTAANWGGWFQGRQLIENAGEYKIEIPVPGSPDALRGKFLVKESNPELDMIRPDFAAMYHLAGEFTEIEQRLDKPTAEKIRNVLINGRYKPEPSATAGTQQPENPEPATSDAPRLYFDLKNAKYIPECMIALTKVQRNRGQVHDLWDSGPTVGYDKKGEPIVLPWMLMGIVGLLSVEWLTRKLLRLA